MAEDYIPAKDFIKSQSPEVANTVMAICNDDGFGYHMRTLWEMECMDMSAIAIAYLFGPITGILVIGAGKWSDTYLTEEGIQNVGGFWADENGEGFTRGVLLPTSE